MTYGETPEQQAEESAEDVAEDFGHNEPSEQQQAGGVINVPQAPAPSPAANLKGEPGEIGVPNVVPSDYDPSQQPYGEAHGVPQPDNKVGESVDSDDDNK